MDTFYENSNRSTNFFDGINLGNPDQVRERLLAKGGVYFNNISIHPFDKFELAEQNNIANAISRIFQFALPIAHDPRLFSHRRYRVDLSEDLCMILKIKYLDWIFHELGWEIKYKSAQSASLYISNLDSHFFRTNPAAL